MHKRKTFCWNTLGCIMQADTKAAWKKKFDTECVSVLHQSAAGMSFWDSKGEKKKKVIIFLCFYCENVKKHFDLLGIPDTSLRGLNTRTALRVRKSKSEPTVERMLRERETDAEKK